MTATLFSVVIENPEGYIRPMTTSGQQDTTPNAYDHLQTATQNGTEGLRYSSTNDWIKLDTKQDSL